MKKVIRFFLRDKQRKDIFRFYFTYYDAFEEHYEGLHGNAFIENAYVFTDKSAYDRNILKSMIQRFSNGFLNRDNLESFEVIDV